MVRAGDALIAIAVGIAFYVFVYKSQWFQNLLTKTGSTGGGGTTTTDGGGGGTTDGGGGGGGVTTGGGTVTGTHIYPTTGKTCQCTDEGPKSGGCSSGGSMTTVRVNCNNCPLANHEATANIQMTASGCGCGGSETTIKHYGPTHSDCNCCWALSNVQQDGKCFFGGEGHHSTTDKTNASAGTVSGGGSLAGKKISIKSVIWKTSGGAHQELYVDPSGSLSKWQKIGARDIAQWGAATKSNKIHPSQQVEFRNDCAGAKWSDFSVVEITPPGGGGGTAAPAAPAAKTPAAKKPLPALAALRIDRAQTALIPMIRSTIRLPHYDFRKLDKEANHPNDKDHCGYVYDNPSDVISMFYRDYFKYRVDNANYKPGHRVFTSNMRR